MWITFCGAAGTVTGSSYLIETAKHRFLVDCGMFQGSKQIRQLNQVNFRYKPAEIDFVLLTHAHVDHCGLLPKLWKQGFKGPVYATKAAAELCKIVLTDSGHIQEMESEWRNRKQLRKGGKIEEPLYTAAEAIETAALLRPQPYQISFKPVPEIRVNFLDAGHILGSAIVEVWIQEEGKTSKIVFSGDLGQKNQPIIQDPTIVQEADYVLMESTYGNRLHEDQSQRIDMLKKIVLETIASNGNLIIPAFAIGRTQDLLYHFKTLFYSGAIPKIPVYIDSPMAVSVTEIYRDNPECYDEETRKLFISGQSPFDFDNLHFIRTAEESKLLNEKARGSIIISASGMCEAGRILHHLKHNLWRPQSHILFVGYQAEGTLGRRLLEGAKIVKIMGEEINVQAKVHSIGAFSAHADQKGLLEWLEGYQNRPQGLFIVHGESDAQQVLASIVEEKLEIRSYIPKLGERFELHQSTVVEQNLPLPSTAQSFLLDQSVTDIEHLLLNLRNNIQASEDTALIHSQIEQIKEQVSKLELLIKQSA